MNESLIAFKQRRRKSEKGWQYGKENKEEEKTEL